MKVLVVEARLEILLAEVLREVAVGHLQAELLVEAAGHQAEGLPVVVPEVEDHHQVVLQEVLLEVPVAVLRAGVPAVHPQERLKILL